MSSRELIASLVATASFVSGVCGDISSMASSAMLDDTDSNDVGSIEFSEASLDDSFFLES